MDPLQKHRSPFILSASKDERPLVQTPRFVYVNLEMFSGGIHSSTRMGRTTKLDLSREI